MSKEDHESPTTRNKILETILTWLKRHHNDDFATSPSLLELLTTFVKSSQPHFESAAWPEILAFIHSGAPQPPKFESYCNHESNYTRAKEIILSGKLPLTEAQAVTLAAIQFQVEHQIEEEPWRDGEISADSMEPFVKKMLPEPFKSKNLTQRIFEEHLTLRGVPDNHAKHMYLKTILALPKYGQKFYDVKLVEEAKKKQTNRVLGVGPNGLFFDEDRHHDSSHQLHIPFKVLQSWGSGSGTLTLNVEGGSPEAPVVYSVLTKKAEEISSLLTRLTTFARDGRDSFEPDLSLDFVECLNCRRDSRFVHLEPEALANLGLKTMLPFAEEMARQLVLVEHGYFTKISLVDVMEYARKSAVTTPGTNAIKAMIQHFNTMSEWVSSEIVKEEDNEQRVKTLSGFIQLARMCVKLRNFNGLMEILSGLNSSAVRKLHNTWKDLPASDLTLFQEFDRLMHSQGNFAEYRRTLENCPLPCLPYFGVFLTDLTFAGDGNADTTVTGKINYSKRWKMYNIVCDIERFQNTPFLFHEIEVIKVYLENVKGIEEDERYVMAQKISVSGSSLKSTNPKNSRFTQTVVGLFKTYSAS